MLMADRLSQFLNAAFSIVVTVSGIVIVTSALQSSKQLLLMLVMFCGNMTVVSALAPENSPLGSSLALVFMPSLPSVMTASDRSTLITRHSPFFSFALVRFTICCISLMSAPFMGPLTFSSVILNRSSSKIFEAS